MARKCILCGKEYKYCKSCNSRVKQEPWNALYDVENCKNISKALTDYNLKIITKEEARNELSKCDTSIELKEVYRNEINEIMSKSKRGSRAKLMVVDEAIVEPTVVEEIVEEIKEEVQEEPNGVVVEE